MRFLYPQGKKKALTFSYDDGMIFDAKLSEIFRKAGMKCTFNLNSIQFAEGATGDDHVRVDRFHEVYDGHEVACHGKYHFNPTELTDSRKLIEFEEDRKRLEELTGGLVFGNAYAFGAYDESTMETLRRVGIHYSRTVNENHRFELPRDFLQWHPTCHHNNDLMQLGDAFLNDPGFHELPVMYVWGHSYEFGFPNDWHLIEEFVEKMKDREEIWYATNGEIYDYVTAVKSVQYSADGRKLQNVSALTLWILTDSNKTIEVKPGEIVSVL